jgi:sugar/nucleoside kinase (ribokinase family)
LKASKSKIMSRSGIVLAGTVILDIVHMVDRWPEQEGVAFVSRTEYGAGGPPHNAAAGLKQLQAHFPVTLQGVVGDDTYGDIFVQQAKAYGLADTYLFRKPGFVTSHTQVMTTIGTGRRTFFHQPGVNAALTPDLLLPRESSAKIFYLGSPGVAKAMDDADHWPLVMKAAKAAGFVTALEMVPLETSILKRLVPQILPYTDIFVVNDHEAAAVTGLTVTEGDRLNATVAIEACKKLLTMGVGSLAAIHHPDGAVAVSRAQETAIAGSVRVERSEIVGTVGAGDAFYAGMLFGIHENWPLEKSLALGNASAATSLHSATTSASIKSWQACLDYAAQRGLRSL